MNFNNVIAFALLLKKITRKSSIGRKHFQQRMRKQPKKEDDIQSTSSSFSSCSEEEEEMMSQVYHDIIENRSSILVSTSSIQQMKVALVFEDKSKSDILLSTNSFISVAPDIQIRDFGYPIDSPLHFGNPLPITVPSTLSLSSPDFNGRDARVLFDFIPETEYEIALKAGQTVWVQYRECPGWLIADVHDETGLIPESYVEFI